MQCQVGSKARSKSCFMLSAICFSVLYNLKACNALSMADRCINGDMSAACIFNSRLISSSLMIDPVIESLRLISILSFRLELDWDLDLLNREKKINESICKFTNPLLKTYSCNVTSIIVFQMTH